MESVARLNPDYDILYEVRLLSRGRFLFCFHAIVALALLMGAMMT